jgi:putative transposase
LLLSDADGFRSVLQAVVQETLEAEMTEALQAHKSERTAARLAYRSGYYERQLVTRVGVLELRVPQDRAGRFSTELFERYQRSEKALVAALAQMYVQGVSTRKVKAITLPASACNAWQVQYRLREQLCMQLITFANGYASRPAIVQLPI